MVAVRGVFALLLLCVGTGCEDKRVASPPSPPTSQGTTGTTAITTTTSPHPGAIDPNRGFSTEDVTVDGPAVGDPKGSGLFRQISIADAQGYERVVFEFEQAMTGTFSVGYDDGGDLLGDVACESPKRANGADLVVSFYGTATTERPYPDFGRSSYTGRQRLRPSSTEDILEAILFCEFEAQLDWVVVVRNRRPFRATTLMDPPRLVLDVQS